MLPWKLRQRHILPVSQNLLSVYFSLAKFQLVGGGGGGGYPREIDRACLPLGREFDMAAILEDREKLEMSDLHLGDTQKR